MKLNKQIVIITGAGSGLGLSCAKHFHELGLQVVAWDRHFSDENQPWTKIHCDVTNEQETIAALEATVNDLGIPRILINCAGIAPAKKIVGREEIMPLSHFSEVIAVNLIGTFNVMRLVAGAMSKLVLEPDEEECGVIINTASIAAYEGQIGQTAYSASKGGIVSLTLPAARELAALKIRVNTIAPGLMATPLLLGMPEEVQQSLSSTVTFPKRFGLAKEFAGLAEHIVSNNFINGEVIRLDGALRMQAR